MNKDEALWPGLLLLLLFMLFCGAERAAKWNETELFKFCADNFRDVIGALLAIASPATVRAISNAMNGKHEPSHPESNDPTKEVK